MKLKYIFIGLATALLVAFASTRVSQQSEENPITHDTQNQRKLDKEYDQSEWKTRCEDTISKIGGYVSNSVNGSHLSFGAGVSYNIKSCKELFFHLKINTRFGRKGRGLRELEFLDGFNHFEDLDFSDNNINDLSYLASILELKKLNLNENNISDISPLKFLTKLNFLTLDENRIQDLTALKHLFNLEFLSIEKNRIQDLSPLKNMPKLRYAYFNNNQIVQLNPLSDLLHLRTLKIHQNKIVNIPPLKGLKQLRKLDLNSNAIENIGGLKDTPNLVILYLNNNKIKNISPLRGLKKIKYLNLNKNQIKRVEPLGDLTQLLSLGLFKNRVEDVETLSNLTNLTFFEVTLGKKQNLDFLENFSKMKYLWIRANPDQYNKDFATFDLNTLKGMVDLEQLTLKGMKLKNEFILNQFKKLWELRLIDCQLENIDFMKNMPKIQRINFSENRLTNISALSNLKDLSYIRLIQNNIKDFTPLTLLPNLRTIKLWKDQPGSLNRLSSPAAVFNSIIPSLNNLSSYELKISHRKNRYGYELDWDPVSASITKATLIRTPNKLRFDGNAEMRFYDTPGPHIDINIYSTWNSHHHTLRYSEKRIYRQIENQIKSGDVTADTIKDRNITFKQKIDVCPKNCLDSELYVKGFGLEEGTEYVGTVKRYLSLFDFKFHKKITDKLIIYEGFPTKQKISEALKKRDRSGKQRDSDFFKMTDSRHHKVIEKVHLYVEPWSGLVKRVVTESENPPVRRETRFNFISINKPIDPSIFEFKLKPNEKPQGIDKGYGDFQIEDFIYLSVL